MVLTVAAQRALPVAALLLLPLSGLRGQDAAAADRIRRQVEAIAAGDTITQRREAIVARLRSIGLSPRLVEFNPPPGSGARRSGANIVADVTGGERPLLLLGAHYDRVNVGRGAIDNAAGVAVVLELAEALTRRPLSRYAVRVALFDLEEAGLLGSRALVADSASVPLPSVYVNFDIFGYGDAFWLGTAPSDLGTPFTSALQGAARAAGSPVRVDSLYPNSDHLSFRGTRTRSYAISLLELSDIDQLLSVFRGGGNVPPSVRILRLIHSADDTIQQLDAAAVSRGVWIVEDALRALDRATGGRSSSTAAP